MKKKKLHRPFMLILYGPTGVGKTDLSLSIADRIPAEIINIDVGQFYKPLSIGTAKPDWQRSSIPHHLFDIIDTPGNYTVARYRDQVYAKVHEVIARGNLPILVGGSGYYIHSLLFPPHAEIEDVDISQLYKENTDLWQELLKVDPIRAASIDKSDTYRIKRALGIWHATGKLPSSFAPVYNPSVDYILIFLQRDREELKKRINARVLEMMDQGWIAEAESLDAAWREFIEIKNLIGYNEIFNYLSDEKTKKSYDEMVQLIQDQTRQYAKRQSTFWRKLEREIKSKSQYTGTSIGCLETINLTEDAIDLYSNQLLDRLPLE